MRSVTITTYFEYPVEMRREMWRTAGKEVTDEMPPLSSQALSAAFISEHSPIRLAMFRVVCDDMLYYTHVHFVRHQFLQPYVVSHRPDKIGRERSVDDTVNLALVGNAQAWIDLMQVRLCAKSSPDTQAWAKVIKRTFAIAHPELAACLVPQCVYRYACPEYHPCGFFEQEIPIPLRLRYQWYATLIAQEYAKTSSAG